MHAIILFHYTDRTGDKVYSWEVKGLYIEAKTVRANWLYDHMLPDKLPFEADSQWWVLDDDLEIIEIPEFGDLNG